MRRFFVKNILFVIAVNILIKPMWAFFIDRTVQSTVGAEAYGTYAALFNITIIFSIMLDFGISSYNTRSIAHNPDQLPELFPAMLSARVVLIGLYLIIACGWGYLFGYRGWKLSLLVGVLLIQSMNAMVSFIRSNIAALQKFKTDGIISVTDRLLMILICGFLLTWPVTSGKFTIQWFVLTQILCYSATALIGYLVLRRIGKVRLKFSFHPATIISIAKQSFPYALLIFQMSIYNRVDVPMMERICPDGTNQASIWAAAFRLLDQANMVGLMFATILLPLFGRMLSQRQDVQPIIKLCVNIMLPLSFMVAVGGIFFSGDIMQLLSHKSALYHVPGMAASYSRVFAILIASFPAWCLMYVYSTLLTANGSLKTLNMIAFAGVVINLSLNCYLIPHYEAVGGAITSFLTQTIMALVFTIFAARTIKLPFNAKWIMAHIGYLGLVIVLGYGIITVLPTMMWMWQLLLFGIVCMAMMFLFRFISLNSIKQLAGKRVTADQALGD